MNELLTHVTRDEKRGNGLRFVLNHENAKGKRKTRKKKSFLNPPLKRRAIVVCPFKGAFGNSPAFKGWDEKFREIRVISCFRDSIRQIAIDSFYSLSCVT